MNLNPKSRTLISSLRRRIILGILFYSSQFQEKYLFKRDILLSKDFWFPIILGITKRQVPIDTSNVSGNLPNTNL